MEWGEFKLGWMNNMFDPAPDTSNTTTAWKRAGVTATTHNSDTDQQQVQRARINRSSSDIILVVAGTN